MAIRTYKVTLNSKNTIAPEPVFLRQGDKTGAVVIDATLMDNGMPVSLDGLTPMFKANTADGQAVIADSTGFNITNKLGGEFTYQVPNALSSVPGKIMTAYFSFSDTSGSESTFDVVFIIKKSVDITQSQADDYITIIDGTLQSLQQKIDAINTDVQTILNAYNQGDFYNKTQTDSKDAATLASAKAYADTQDATVLTSVTTEMEQGLDKKVDKSGSGQVTYANLAQDVRTALTGGSVAVVGTDAVLEVNVTDKSITPDKASFLDVVKGNLFDLNTISSGYYVSDSTGLLLDNASYVASDYIKVEPNTPYYCSDPRLSAWYTKDKVFISGLTNGYTVPQTSPSNARYIRITFDISNYSRQYFGKKSSWVFSSGKQQALFPSADLKNMVDRIVIGKKSSINDIYGISANFKSLVNPYEVQANKMIDPYNGFVVNSTGNYVTGFIPVEVGAQYCCSVTRPYAYYDADKKYISGQNGSGAWTNPLTIPAGVAYIRITISSTSDVFSKGATLLTSAGYGDGTIIIDTKLKQALIAALQITVTDLKSPLYGKKINALGDSITSVDYTVPNWWQQIATETGATFNNYGVSGTCLADNAQREIDFGPCMAKRYTSMDATADAVIVMGGTNDNYLTARGSWTSTDITTLFGALNVMMTGLLTNFPGKPILFCTPMQRADSYNASDYRNQPLSFLLNTQTDESTIPVQLIAEAIKAKCAQYSIPCLDLFNGSGINGVVTGQYHRDIWHPNALGQSVLKREIGDRLERLF